MSDPVGGREAEIEAVARVLWDLNELRNPSGERDGFTEADLRRSPVFWDQAVSENLWPGSRAETIEDARRFIEMLLLDALRSSGSATQNQEDEGLSIHVDVCPDCGEPTSYHPMDPPMQCTHDRERYVPVRFIEARSPQGEDHEA